MACSYFLKTGDSVQEFANEAALTDALLTKYEYFKEFGDVVFSHPTRFALVKKNLKNVIEKGETEEQYISDYYSGEAKVEYDEDGQVLLMEKPAMGVNKFLATYQYMENGAKKQIIPEFREVEYWNKKKQDWLLGKFDEKDKKNITEIEGENFNFEDKNLITESKIEYWKKAILDKWNAQGKTGTALHAVAEKFFSKDSKTGKYNFELLDENPDLLQEWYPDFAKSLDKYKSVTYGDFVNEAQFNKMIEMCKKLRSQITDEYGEGCEFFPELTVASDITQEFNGCTKIVGIIDLLVVDSDGRTHIYDYKTSPKPYRDYDSAKKRAFTYQLAVYNRILLHFGINTYDGTCKIIPVKLENFRIQDGEYVYDDVKFTVNNSIDSVEMRDLSTTIAIDDNITENLNRFLPPDVNMDPVSDKLLEKVQEIEKKITPKFNILSNSTDLEIDDMLRKAGAYTPNKLGMLTFTLSSGSKVITLDASETNADLKLFEKVKQEIKSLQGKKASLASNFAEHFRLAVQNKTDFILEGAQDLGGNSNWLTEMITPYCNGDYELLEENASKKLGMVFLKNVHTGNITVLKLTFSKLDRLIEFGKGRSNINGKYSTDIEENSKGDSLMLRSYQGNIEAIEAMLALLHIDFGGKVRITDIRVINPKQQREMPFSNKELLYTYNNLLDNENFLDEGEVNKFRKDGEYELLDETAKLHEHFIHILNSSNVPTYLQFTDIKESISDLIFGNSGDAQTIDWNNYEDKEKLLTELNKLRIKVERELSQKVSTVRTKLSDINSPEYLLYYQIMMAIKELKGVDTRQQIKDADNWILNGNFAKIFSEGWEGLMLENPGNFKSPALNQLTKSISNVYLKIKDTLNKKNRTVRKLMEDLKKESNYGWMSNNVSGNETDLFLDMTYESDGDFLFVNPNTLTGAKKRFLEFALDSINRDRYPSTSDEDLETMKENNDPRYYGVPLMKASSASMRSVEGVTSALNDRLKSWKPGNALKDAREKLEGFFFEEDEDREREKEELYQMGTKFDIGESNRREELIKRLGINSFEHNIETILLHHAYAYSLRKEMNSEMPIIKATAMCLAMQGAGANLSEEGFPNLIKFIENYITFAVKNKNINKHFLGKEGSELVGKVKMATSILALGFSPLLFTYQTVEGIWKACALIWKKPDGTEAFTCKNMWEAFKSAYSDLAYYKTRPSKGMQINEMYGINDMDSNLFAERISSDKSIWTHFTDFAFRFASRPDYYNRMTIFGAQMRKDGTWDAHTLDKEGNLIYDWKLDKRYDAYAKGDKNDPRYLECKSRYLAALQQFLIEGVTNDDGTPLKIGDALPRAYTNQEAQAMKAIADNMYGYYNHETKSMLSATTMGALAMQMKTYWSAKKNQYLAPGGCKLMGHWEDYLEPKKDENGNILKDAQGNPIMEQLYYAAGADGEIDLSKGFVTADDPNCSKIRVLKWKGQYLEGIVSTIVRFGKAWKESGYSFAGFDEAWLDMWFNSDDNLRTAYRSNIKHLLFDLVFMLGMGNILALAFGPEDDELKKLHYADRGNLDKALAYASYDFMYRTFKQSFMDFNFIDSIFSPTVDWQPMSFSSISKLMSNVWEYTTTDKSFASTLANSSAVTRLAKPLIRALTYED